MRTNKLLKKALVLALTVFIFTSFYMVGAVPKIVKADENPVQFYSANYHYEAGGGVSWYIADIYVRVKVDGIYSSATRNVTLHAKTYTTSWSDYSCSYVGDLGNGYQLWKCKLYSSFQCQYQFDFKYEVNGQIYWDNNNGNNYTQNNSLGVATVKAHQFENSTDGTSSANANIFATVKNLSYNKVVKVRYTEDNWKTYKDVNLSFIKTNVDGSEEWGTYIYSDLYSSLFHYDICYQVNGQTYWDNNCGINYNYE